MDSKPEGIKRLFARNPLKCFINMMLAASLPVVISGVVVYYLAHQFDMNIFFNSDVLVPAGFYRDFFINKFPYSSFYFSQANFFFPDIFIWIAIQSLINNIYFVFPVFFTFQIIMVLTATFLIMKHFMGLSRSALSACLAGSVMCGLVVATTGGLNYSPYSPILIPVQHFGIYIAGLVILSLTLGYMRGNQTGSGQVIYASAIYILVTATALSDRLFINQFVLPLVTALFACPRKKLFNRQIFILIGIMLAGTSTGILLSRAGMVNPNPCPEIISFNDSPAGLYASCKDFINICLNFPVISVLICLFYSSVLIIIIQKRKDFFIDINDESRLYLFVSLFIVIQAFFTITLPLMMKYFVIVPRYFMPVFFTPVLFFPVIIRSFRESKFINFCLYITPMGIAFVFLFMIYARPVYYSYKPEYVAKFDEILKKYDIKYGIAPYWLARHLMLLSDNDPWIAQSSFGIRPYLWETSGAYYRGKYYYAVSNNKLSPSSNLDISKLISICGRNPDYSYNIGNMTVYIFQDGFPLPDVQKEFDNINNTKSAKITLYPYYFISQIGTLEGKSIVSDGKNGFLIYGPYVDIRRGTYMVTFHGSINGGNDNEEAGVADIVYDSGRKVISSGVISPHNDDSPGKNVLSRQRITLNRDIGPAEFRIWLKKNSYVTLDYVEIEKINK